MTSAITQSTVTGAAFDSLADQYDAVFTNTLVGRAQRNVVWQVLDRVSARGEKVLELNCGTGEDALHLAKRGVTVTACDASARMIEVARQKVQTIGFGNRVSFHHLATERIAELGYRAPFDGVLSNFSGLNCVEDLSDVADQLASLIRPAGYMLLCVSTRVCGWELCMYGLRGEWSKAARRLRGKTMATIRGAQITVAYPTVGELEAAFSPWFILRERVAVGLFIPPSYMDEWCQRHPRTFRFLAGVDEFARSWPILRGMGDHALLRFERCAA